jgi:multidrug resistance protein, MATE family
LNKSITTSIARLALPIFIGQIALMLNGVIDTVMAGRISAVDQAAVGIGMSVFFSVFVPLMGVLLAVAPTISQHFGAGDNLAVGEDVRQGFWMTIIVSIAVFLLIYFPDPFLAISQLTPEVETKTRTYLRFAAFGAVAQMTFRLFYGFTTAIGQPRVVMSLSVFALILKIALNIVFVYGHFGFSAMGGPGCALATTVAVWVTIFISLVIAVRNPNYKKFAIFERWSWPKREAQMQLWKLGLPMGATFLIDVTSFTFMALFLARLGATASAAHGIATNLAASSYMLPMSMSIAVSVLVGQALGAGDARLARRIGVIGFVLALLCALVLAAAIALWRNDISAIYSSENAVRVLASELLLLIAVYHVFDALLAMGINALRGYKNAFIPMLVCAVCLWGIGLAGGYVLGLISPSTIGLPGKQPLGAPGFWYAAIVSYASACVIVAVYFNYVSQVFIRKTAKIG